MANNDKKKKDKKYGAMRFIRKRSYGADMNRKTRSKAKSKIIRKTDYFSLRCVKNDSTYILRDIKNYEEMPITRQEIDEMELTICNGIEFNFQCTHFFE